MLKLIERFKKNDFSNISLDKYYEIKKKVLEFPNKLPVFKIQVNEDFRIYRGRLSCSSIYFNKISELSYSKINNKFGRANEPEQSIFYGSNSYDAVFFETMKKRYEKYPNERETLCIGIWQPQSTLDLSLIIQPNKEKRVSDFEIFAGQEFDRELASLSPEDREFAFLSMELYYDLFTHVAQSEKNYIATSLITNSYFFPTTEGVVFPNESFGNKGMNVALKSEVIDNQTVQLVKVIRNTFDWQTTGIKEIEDKGFFEETETIDYYNNKISWHYE